MPSPAGMIGSLGCHYFIEELQFRGCQCRKECFGSCVVDTSAIHMHTR
jgi:hypothetical protein